MSKSFIVFELKNSNNNDYLQTIMAPKKKIKYMQEKIIRKQSTLLDKKYNSKHTQYVFILFFNYF
ncbi:hypothetical protein GCM10022423_29980 [Flavobacterium ginsengiterrae]|uniref:Uncharacterized protein n=1 Tax=Flavobacterium ginsengiterrae TaxID=871695 RepID=A0ABP7GSP8_9FLAO